MVLMYRMLAGHKLFWCGQPQDLGTSSKEDEIEGYEFLDSAYATYMHTIRARIDRYSQANFLLPVDGPAICPETEFLAKIHFLFFHIHGFRLGRSIGSNISYLYWMYSRFSLASYGSHGLLQP